MTAVGRRSQDAAMGTEMVEGNRLNEGKRGEDEERVARRIGAIESERER